MLLQNKLLIPLSLVSASAIVPLVVINKSNSQQKVASPDPIVPPIPPAPPMNLNNDEEDLQQENLEEPKDPETLKDQ